MATDNLEQLNGQLFEIPLLSLLQDNVKGVEDIVVEDEDNDKTEDDHEVEMPEENDEVIFSMHSIPGAPEDIVLDEEPEEEVEEEPEEDIEEEIDDWGWEKSHGTSKFIKWLKGMIEKVPSHSGSDTTGVERAMAYFERLNTEISRAMRKDYKNEIDAAKAEEARSLIEDGLKRLRDRLERLHEKKFKKIKKKADIKSVFVKTAATSFTGATSVNIPYFISMIARICINATVSSGKDMNDIFNKQIEKYKLDKREQVQIIQLIKDMGFAANIDRMKFDEDEIDISNNEGELAAQYPA